LRTFVNRNIPFLSLHSILYGKQAIAYLNSVFIAKHIKF